MQIKVPKVVALACDRLMDGLAAVLLPPPRPLFTIRGYTVTLTEVGVAAWASVMAAAIVWYTGNPWWIAAVIGSMIFCAILYPPHPPVETRRKETK